MWHMVQYCLDFPYGKVRHFPAGTYNEQISESMGKIELELMSVTHAVWYTFKHVPMKKWGESELRTAKLAEPLQPKPEEPTGMIDKFIRDLWPDSFFQHQVMFHLRRIDAESN